MNPEWFDLVNHEGVRIGKAMRSVCHGNPGLTHQAVHVLVFNRHGHLFLQKRALAKDVQPGKWDTSVGGHLLPGEAPEAGARREMREELGVEPERLHFAYRYLWRSEIESEWITTFSARHDGPFRLDEQEIMEGRFWPLPGIGPRLHDGTFTPQFQQEFGRVKDLYDAGIP